MSGDYISREDVCLQLEKQASIDGQPRAIRRARRIVAEFPAADVVEVVRCRECVFGNMPCAMARYPDYFCADGKRKAGGQDE